MRHGFRRTHWTPDLSFARDASSLSLRDDAIQHHPKRRSTESRRLLPHTVRAARCLACSAVNRGVRTQSCSRARSVRTRTCASVDVVAGIWPARRSPQILREKPGSWPHSATSRQNFPPAFTTPTCASMPSTSLPPRGPPVVLVPPREQLRQTLAAVARSILTRSQRLFLRPLRHIPHALGGFVNTSYAVSPAWARAVHPRKSLISVILSKSTALPFLLTVCDLRNAYATMFAR